MAFFKKFAFAFHVLTLAGALLSAQSGNPTGSTTGALANATSVSQEISNSLDPNYFHQVSTFDNRYKGILGSPYYIDGWMPGRLFLNDSSLVRDTFRYKFDCAANELWILNNQGQERILYSYQFKSFELHHHDGRRFLFKKYKVPGENPHQFYKSVYEGKRFTLICDTQKRIKKADLEDRGLVTTGSPYDKFLDKFEYHIRVGSGDFRKVALKKSHFKSLIHDGKTKAFEAFCKENGIKGRLSEEEAVRILRYLDKS